MDPEKMEILAKLFNAKRKIEKRIVEMLQAERRDGYREGWKDAEAYQIAWWTAKEEKK